MFKRLVISIALMIFLTLLSGQARIYTQQIMLKNGLPPTNVYNVTNDSSAEDYIVEAYLADPEGVPYPGCTLSTDPTSQFYTEPSNLHLKRYNSQTQVRVTQMNIFQFKRFEKWDDYVGKRVFMRVIYTGSDPWQETDWWSVIIPNGDSGWIIKEPAQVIPPFTFNDLKVTSEPPGASILRNGKNTGYQTPATFPHSGNETYAVALDGFTWKPESYMAAAHDKASKIDFQGSYYEPPELAQALEPITISMNSDFVIKNLGKYFKAYDPESNYNIVGKPVIKWEVIGNNSIRITPDKGWTGVEHLNIVLTDRWGRKAEQEVKITVQ